MSTRPLDGRRILITRRPEQAGSLAHGLRALGAEVVEVPTVAIAPPEDPAPLDNALLRLAERDWVVFASANAVSAVAERLRALGLALGAQHPRLASVGSATSAALAEAWPGAAIALQPSSDFRAEGLLAAFEALCEPAGLRCLLPLADRARDTLATGLRRLGYRIDSVIAYRTVTPPGLGAELERIVGMVDLSVFASPSAVESYAQALGERGRGAAAVVIGPTTAEAAEQAGLVVRAVASPSTVPGLIEAVARALA